MKALVLIALTISALALGLLAQQPAAAAACGPGLDWVSGCPAGVDDLDPTAALGKIDMDLDCVLDDPDDSPFTIKGPATIDRQAAIGEEIETEIVSMQLTGTVPGLGTITLRAGSDAPARPPSTGKIEQKAPPKNNLADSFFDVFFELDTPLGTLHNDDGDPAHVTAVIDQVPPKDVYHEFSGCIWLYNAADVHVVNLVRARHIPGPIGGITELTDEATLPLSESGSSDGFGLAGYGAVVGGLAAAVAAAVAGGWYGRRRLR